MANSVDPDQTGAVCSESTLFASILDSSVILQQTTSAVDIFRCISLLGALGLRRCRGQRRDFGK